MDDDSDTPSKKCRDRRQKYTGQGSEPVDESHQYAYSNDDIYTTDSLPTGSSSAASTASSDTSTTAAKPAQVNTIDYTTSFDIYLLFAAKDRCNAANATHSCLDVIQHGFNEYKSCHTTRRCS